MSIPGYLFSVASSISGSIGMTIIPAPKPRKANPKRIKGTESGKAKNIEGPIKNMAIEHKK